MLRRWLFGDFEVMASSELLADLRSALGYSKIRKRIPPEDADELIELLSTTATMADVGDQPPSVPSSDPGDDYLIQLGAATGAVIVSGDRHLLDLRDKIPVFNPAEFLSFLAEALR